YLERVVNAKLGSVAKDLEPGVHAFAIVAADTVVTIGGEILGKPRDRADSARMIAQLSGQPHAVLTRFAIGGLDGKILHEETVTTTVTFRKMTDAEQQHYVASGEGDDKAGAYAVQGKGAAFVSKIDGSYANVVGLPVCELVVALHSLGFSA
ncbi:MAG: Maf family protein, partial [Polyangiaceae bacterium]